MPFRGSTLFLVNMDREHRLPRGTGGAFYNGNSCFTVMHLLTFTVDTGNKLLREFVLVRRKIRAFFVNALKMHYY